ncbi:MAG: site-2 protease family protein [Corallococcus sp.]|nr:site-2 protease family protein [Corallococcus sp.]
MDGVKLKVQADFWIFLAAAVLFRQGYFACMYVIAVLLHETAHYVVASRLFYHCKEIRLGIFGATLYGDFQDVTRKDRIKIALAGPLCNLVLCLACLAVWWLYPDSYYYTENFFVANVSMACVNLLPCYPLDGGRILTGILEGKLGKKSVSVAKGATAALSACLFAVFAVSLFTKDNLFNVGLFAICLFLGTFANVDECYVKTAFAVNKSEFLRKGMEKKTLVFDQNNKLSEVASACRAIFCTVSKW